MGRKMRIEEISEEKKSEMVCKLSRMLPFNVEKADKFMDILIEEQNARNEKKDLDICHDVTTNLVNPSFISLRIHIPKEIFFPFEYERDMREAISRMKAAFDKAHSYNSMRDR